MSQVASRSVEVATAVPDEPTSKPSVLFVDDDPRILDGLRRSLRPQRHDWTMDFCTSGEAALQHLSTTGCDVVVSDMRMPGMNGAELLSRVSRTVPAAARVVLSGHTEPEAGIRAALVGHRFLSKPCDPGALVELLGQVRRGVRAQAGGPVRAVSGAVRCLPIRPAQLERLGAALSTPDAPQAEVVEAVVNSIGLAAKLLQLANSRFFGPGTRVLSVSYAVSALGVPFVKSLLDEDPALWSAPADAATQQALDTTYRFSVASAKLTRELATPADAPYAKMAGLLQGVGRLALVGGQVPHDPSTATCADAVGSDLLHLWGLPEPVVTAAADRHGALAVRDGDLGVTGALRAARLLLQGTACADPLDEACPEELRELLSHPQLTAAGIDWQARADAVADETVQALG